MRKMSTVATASEQIVNSLLMQRSTALPILASPQGEAVATATDVGAFRLIIACVHTQLSTSSACVAGTFPSRGMLLRRRPAYTHRAAISPYCIKF